VGPVHARRDDGGQRTNGVDALSVEVVTPGTPVTLKGSGNGPIAAFVDAIAGRGVEVRVLDYSEHAMSAGGDATAAAFVECQVGDRVPLGRRHRREHRARLAQGGRQRGEPAQPRG
jgi:2-isopropylmalate synthase